MKTVWENKWSTKPEEPIIVGDRVSITINGTKYYGNVTREVYGSTDRVVEVMMDGRTVGSLYYAKDIQREEAQFVDAWTVDYTNFGITRILVTPAPNGYLTKDNVLLRANVDAFTDYNAALDEATKRIRTKIDSLATLCDSYTRMAHPIAQPFNVGDRVRARLLPTLVPYKVLGVRVHNGYYECNIQQTGYSAFWAVASGLEKVG